MLGNYPKQSLTFNDGNLKFAILWLTNLNMYLDNEMYIVYHTKIIPATSNVTVLNRNREYFVSKKVNRTMFYDDKMNLKDVSIKGINMTEELFDKPIEVIERKISMNMVFG